MIIRVTVQDEEGAAGGMIFRLETRDHIVHVREDLDLVRRLGGRRSAFFLAEFDSSGEFIVGDEVTSEDGWWPA